MATYYQAMVARDQLEQSREEAEKESRDQATRVSWWIEDHGSGPERIHVMNRSVDPLSHVSVALGLWMSDEYALGGSLAPCSELVYKLEAISYQEHSPHPSWRPLGDRAWGVEYVAFVDRDGKTWKRDTALTPMDPSKLIGTGGIRIKGGPEIERVASRDDGKSGA
ncbi:MULTISPECIES: hypothetical protein [Streptomyces]|uniref:Uncharacterized protein n=1 Tax=Streptomyces lonegramiae TaxID=3075524 RepID=A0ABU2XNZ6_9ACTN|nr:hypothetical protein [Streptomyces sp. DSM 41529]MDT0547653.1 hypothetical protein [Streptomyces sp. DSM 41529]